MNGDHSSHIATWQEHIRVLAGEIGPRGSTTENERRASEYCEQVLRRLRLTPRLEEFISARSAYQLHLLVALLMLLSFILYPLAGRISALLAALVALIGLYSEIRELRFRNNPLRRLIAKGSGQNVIATLPPAGDHRQDLVLIGHVDTNRTPIIFSSNGWVNLWRIFAATAFFLFCGQAVLYAIGAVTQWAWIWPVTGISAVAAVLLAATCIHADLTPYSPGANDNATGAGLVLTLADHLQSEPLQHTRVWLVCTGCEEVKHYGAVDFFSRHQADLYRPAVLVFEMLGRDGPGWLTEEGIIPPFRTNASPVMVEMAERLAAEHPEWKAHPTHVSGGNTEMVDALRLGIPAITLIGVGPDGTRFNYRGRELYWHKIEDTPDKIDPEVLGRAYAFAWALIRALDGAAE
ncbi:MAG TPA: M28 family peptidase [Chloroflexi bacterium]|nr:M28 family peptidase [Chloroflexota bacterium]